MWQDYLHLLPITLLTHCPAVGECLCLLVQCSTGTGGVSCGFVGRVVLCSVCWFAVVYCGASGLVCVVWHLGSLREVDVICGRSEVAGVLQWPDICNSGKSQHLTLCASSHPSPPPATTHFAVHLDSSLAFGICTSSPSPPALRLVPLACADLCFPQLELRRSEEGPSIHRLR